MSAQKCIKGLQLGPASGRLCEPHLSLHLLCAFRLFLVLILNSQQVKIQAHVPLLHLTLSFNLSLFLGLQHSYAFSFPFGLPPLLFSFLLMHLYLVLFIPLALECTSCPQTYSYESALDSAG